MFFRRSLLFPPFHPSQISIVYTTNSTWLRTKCEMKKYRPDWRVFYTFFTIHKFSLTEKYRKVFLKRAINFWCVKATQKNDTICWNTSISGYKNIDQSIPINCEWSRKMAMNTSLTKSSQHFFWLNVSSHWFPSSFFGLCWVISQRHIFIGKSFWTWIC